jgi:hypothetical protein
MTGLLPAEIDEFPCIFPQNIAAGKDPAKTPARATMTRLVTCCFEDQDCGEAARLMPPDPTQLHDWGRI